MYFENFLFPYHSFFYIQELPSNITLIHIPNRFFFIHLFLSSFLPLRLFFFPFSFYIFQPSIFFLLLFFFFLTIFPPRLPFNVYSFPQLSVNSPFLPSLFPFILCLLSYTIPSISSGYNRLRTSRAL